VRIKRSTLAGWIGGACWWLEPLHARLAAQVFGSTKLFAYDTPVPVLDPGRGRTKTGRLWVYARDDRSWAEPEPPLWSASTVPIARPNGLRHIWPSSMASKSASAGSLPKRAGKLETPHQNHSS
jgi:hypothetical protein